MSVSSKKDGRLASVLRPGGLIEVLVDLSGDIGAGATGGKVPRGRSVATSVGESGPWMGRVGPSGRAVGRARGRAVDRAGGDQVLGHAETWLARCKRLH